MPDLFGTDDDEEKSVFVLATEGLPEMLMNIETWLADKEDC